MHLIRRALLLWLQLAMLVAAGAGTRVSAPRSLAWGPGLQAAAVLPVRYFFLQSVDSDGRNFTSSPPGQRPGPSPRVPSRPHSWACPHCGCRPLSPPIGVPSLLPDTHGGGRRRLGPLGDCHTHRAMTYVR